MDKDSVDRIRSATFPIARRGYEKREVERYLNQLADWLETGGGDEARSDLVRRELERIGEQTGGILTEAHDAAEGIRAQTERDIRRQLSDANVKAESMRSSAEEYAAQAREEADAYALKARSDVDAYAERVRIDADGHAEETRADAEGYSGRIREEAEGEAAKLVEAARAEAAKLVEEGNRRKVDVEAVISDLERRRDTIVGELERLATEVAGTATQHRPEAVAAAAAGPEAAETTGEPEAPATTPDSKSKRVTATRAK